MLACAPSHVGVLNREPELTFAAEALVVIKGIVAAEGSNEVLRVYRSTKPLVAVVEVGINFYEVNGRSASNSSHGEAIDLVAFNSRDGKTTVTNRDVLEYTAVVVVVRTTVEGWIG